MKMGSVIEMEPFLYVKMSRMVSLTLIGNYDNMYNNA